MLQSLNFNMAHTDKTKQPPWLESLAAYRFFKEALNSVDLPQSQKDQAQATHNLGEDILRVFVYHCLLNIMLRITTDKIESAKECYSALTVACMDFLEPRDNCFRGCLKYLDRLNKVFSK